MTFNRLEIPRNVGPFSGWIDVRNQNPDETVISLGVAAIRAGAYVDYDQESSRAIRASGISAVSSITANLSANADTPGIEYFSGRHGTAEAAEAVLAGHVVDDEGLSDSRTWLDSPGEVLSALNRLSFDQYAWGDRRRQLYYALNVWTGQAFPHSSVLLVADPNNMYSTQQQIDIIEQTRWLTIKELGRAENLDEAHQLGDISLDGLPNARLRAVARFMGTRESQVRNTEPTIASLLDGLYAPELVFDPHFSHFDSLPEQLSERLRTLALGQAAFNKLALAESKRAA